MNAKTLYPSKWLSASDAEGNRRLTIKGFRMEVVGAEQKEKGVLYFVQTDKGLVLNRANTEKMIDLFGEETDKWLGMDIIVTTVQVQYKGSEVPAIRIKGRGVPAQ